MKRVLYMFTLAVCGCLFLASCSSDEYEDKVSSVVSTAADTQIPAIGGTKTITVTGQGITAAAEDSWLNVSVSGNTITVSADANNSRESRHTIVVAKASNGDKAIINVSQMGTIFFVETAKFDLDDEKRTVTTNVMTSSPSQTVTVSSEDSWLTGTYNSQTGTLTVNVDANNTGVSRTGSLTVSSGDYNSVITITQTDFKKDVLGEYYFVYSKNVNGTQWVDIPAELTTNSLKLYLSEESPLVIPIKMPNGNKAPYELTADFGSYLGDFTLQEKTYNCYLGFDNDDYKFLSRYTAYFFKYMGATQATISLSMNTEDNGYVWFGGFGEGVIDFDGEEYGDISTWYILAMSQKEFAQANLVGSLSTMYWPYLEKVVKEEEGGAKAFAKRGAPRRIKK